MTLSTLAQSPRDTDPMNLDLLVSPTPSPTSPKALLSTKMNDTTQETLQGVVPNTRLSAAKVPKKTTNPRGQANPSRTKLPSSRNISHQVGRSSVSHPILSPYMPAPGDSTQHPQEPDNLSRSGANTPIFRQGQQNQLALQQRIPNTQAYNLGIPPNPNETFYARISHSQPAPIQVINTNVPPEVHRRYQMMVASAQQAEQAPRMTAMPSQEPVLPQESHPIASSVCVVCQRPAVLICICCSQTTYCSGQCQQKGQSR